MRNKEKFRKASSIIDKLIIELENCILKELDLSDEFVNNLWEIQSNIEYSILIIKLYLDEDNIIFLPKKDPQITEIKEIIQESLTIIKNARQHMKNGKNLEAINDLRYGGYLIKNALVTIRRKP